MCSFARLSLIWLRLGLDCANCQFFLFTATTKPNVTWQENTLLNTVFKKEHTCVLLNTCVFLFVNSLIVRRTRTHCAWKPFLIIQLELNMLLD